MGRKAKRTADPISQGLQKLFQSVADEAIPEEFMALLDQIDAKAAENPAPIGSPPGVEETE